ncbi:hypothetical protein OG453_07595 [Streptomyces sp. NBC_01381]|uniref:hypothetical protein n=1 Tax=Streptomyces sp. NBC_01381 TaxID=2903845 RepID=UPI00224D8C80|nr:hypothetical protein [Streptomyces sp. NBC_01381]MCX4666533.1 hypothetical protein [Streptomyces sp. NBC_01381]
MDWTTVGVAIGSAALSSALGSGWLLERHKRRWDDRKQRMEILEPCYTELLLRLSDLGTKIAECFKAADRPLDDEAAAAWFDEQVKDEWNEWRMLLRRKQLRIPQRVWPLILRADEALYEPRSYFLANPGVDLMAAQVSLAGYYAAFNELQATMREDLDLGPLAPTPRSRRTPPGP